MKAINNPQTLIYGKPSHTSCRKSWSRYCPPWTETVSERLLCVCAHMYPCFVTSSCPFKNWLPLKKKKKKIKDMKKNKELAHISLSRNWSTLWQITRFLLSLPHPRVHTTSITLKPRDHNGVFVNLCPPLVGASESGQCPVAAFTPGHRAGAHEYRMHCGCGTEQGWPVTGHRHASEDDSPICSTDRRVNGAIGLEGRAPDLETWLLPVPLHLGNSLWDLVSCFPTSELQLPCKIGFVLGTF